MLNESYVYLVFFLFRGYCNKTSCPCFVTSLCFWFSRPNFNNQHKPTFPKKNHYVNTKLEVRRIPRELNNITKLNEHFSKFGTIVNIQVMIVFKLLLALAESRVKLNENLERVFVY